MTIKKISILIISFLFLQNCFSQTELLSSAIKNVTDVIVHDVFTPPVACRIYTYSTIAAYQSLEPAYKNFNSLYGKLNEMPVVPPPEEGEKIDYALAAIYALYYTAKSFVFSEQLIQDEIDEFRINCSTGKSEKEIIDTENYGRRIAEIIIAWSSNDNYKETRSMPRFTLNITPGAWQPTAPDHADAIEPYWGELRPFILDSATCVYDHLPIDYATDTNSQFYKDALEVFNTVNNLTPEQKQIATFWDDNPFTTYYVGHMQFARKKISPPGHWLYITREAIVISNCDFEKAAFAYALVCIVMSDAFISCWKQKYISNTVRPETYINKFISEAWKPFLQTPPFPEFPSGHSTISAASATILTHLFGESFAFTDSSEAEFELPARTFTSFIQAANEASISRLYGGIHFIPAIEKGKIIGVKISNVLIQKFR